MVLKPIKSDDPLQRQPVIDRAKKQLLWEPTVPLDEGVDATIEWFKQTF